MMVAVAIIALLSGAFYGCTVGSFYGPGGELDREYARAEREWMAEHPGQPYTGTPGSWLAPWLAW